MKSITIFTPTYNRAYCLHQCYNSLLTQTNKDFVWLIIDDGSTDETESLVNGWISDNHIEIHYHFQKNQGMHGGHNTAYDLIQTELNICIDSDDFMPSNAVENILEKWNSIENRKGLAGIIGLDAHKDGKIIGETFPQGLEKSTLEDLYFKHRISGDKKLVLLTEVVNKYERYPIFKDERFVPLGILYLRIDKDYKLACLDKVLCVVEYMEDGSSRNIFKQYLKHPKGFQYARMVTMKHSNYFKVKFKNSIHYVSHSIQLKDLKFLQRSPKKLMTLIVIPFGILLYGYVNYVNRNK